MNTRSIKIGECAEVLPGYALKTYVRHEPRGTHQVILGKHLPALSMEYDYHPAHELRITPKSKVEKYLVKTGDVLLISRGIRNQAVLVENVPEKTIASATFYLLRMRDGVDGAYLTWFLNQDSVQNRIGQARTGAGTPIVQRKVFEDIMIPLPSSEDQRKIAKLGACMTKERRIRQALADRTVELHTLIGRQLIQDPMWRL
ncbi:MAG: Type I restriction modification DNA specificity domain-containing protein [Candidatus Kentron sp. G]|nr:MAG: Type I restriction modification DNA specificity domain-containing protein [Candidatus Kentron sp. G]VFN03039.1 MAG: Type I restriction modification DNA specificity domain-containing protein [Candidatus Kentron sp. G]VFN04596.1 MAG: Type I restriction modification DNA specificity domain-containing protein [Candidatus Kentron sp. G]